MLLVLNLRNHWAQLKATKVSSDFLKSGVPCIDWTMLLKPVLKKELKQKKFRLMHSEDIHF